MPKVVIISGGKLLAKLNLSEEGLTPKIVCESLIDKPIEEVRQLFEDCIERIKCVDEYTGTECLYPTHKEISDLKRRIKYEKNPMAKANLQRELSGLSYKYRRNKVI